MANVLLGVSAGIAIYKSADLASNLTQRGHGVRTLMTPHSLKFISPLTFRAVTREAVYTDTFDDDPAHRPEHISLSEWGDVLVVAPATADLLGRLACGLGDNVLAATALAFRKPVVVAPAMNDQMWANGIVQENIEKLRRVLDYHFVEPGEGYLACGSVGPGRMAEVEEIIAAMDRVLQPAPSARPGSS